MAIQVNIIMRFEGIQALLTKRGNFTRKGREIFRAAHLRQALAWHALHLPRHFEQSAAGRYGYQKRTAKYMEQKKKSYFGFVRAQRQGRAGDTKRPRATSLVDLVWSGRLREAALAPPLVRPYPTRATLTMTLPACASMRPKMLGNPNLARELTTVIGPEREELAALLGREVARGMGTIHEHTTVAA